MDDPILYVGMGRRDERDGLRAWLEFHRSVAIRKIRGVDGAGLDFSPVGSGTSLRWV